MKKLIAFSIGLGLTLFGATNASAYTVKSGDTLSEIAANHNVELEEVIDLNPQIVNPHKIFPNDEIRLPNESVVVKKSTEVSLTNSEELLLARLVEAEAKNQPFEGKVAVAKVVLNRVESNLFPNDIRSVIYQPRQFSPVSNGMINGKASNESKHAVQEALNRGGNANGALFFYNPQYSFGQSWFNTRRTAFVIGDHVFKH
nr:hypothetical protein 33 [Bacillaceae bacterium]